MKTVLLTGIVQSGGDARVQPCANVPVAICEAAATAALALAYTSTDGEGRFSVEVPVRPGKTIAFAVADLGGGIVLVAVLGLTIPGSVVINEITTVAAAFSTAQFNRNGWLSGDSFGLGLTAGMNDNIADVATGLASGVLLAAPNAGQTIAVPTLYSLANLVAACVRQVPGVFASLLQLAAPPYGQAPLTTFEALANITRYPGRDVNDIYALTTQSPVYDGALTGAPAAWTLAVKVNLTGDASVLFGGPGNLVFDDKGYAWITNNVVQGTPASTNNVIVLQPNGQPADGAEGTPRSPVTGGGILGGGFGIDIAPDGTIWTGNFGWGNDNPGPDASGSVSQLSASGVPLSVPDGYQGGTDRAQSVVADNDGNIWIASFGNNRIVVFPKGNPDAAFWFQEENVDLPPAAIIEIYKNTGYEVPPNGAAPFGIAIAFDGTAWATHSGGLWEGTPGSVCRYAIETDTEGKQSLKRLSRVKEGHALKGIALDSMGNAWVASGGNGAVFLFNPDGELVQKIHGVGGIDCPWSVAVDGNEDVWVANFCPMLPNSNFTTAALSHLKGKGGGSFWPDLAPGAPISPSTGYTLASGGDPVLLSNTDPLYGPGAEPNYSPLMRMTNCIIDQAGNVWALNNWKPIFAEDYSETTGNPGGDGVVIFIGLAAPPQN